MTFKGPFQPEPLYSLFYDSMIQVYIQTEVIQPKHVGTLAESWLFPTNTEIFKIKLLGVLLLSTCSTGCRPDLDGTYRCTKDESSSRSTAALFHWTFGSIFLRTEEEID